MTTDHDPRELREAAERCRDSMAIPRDTVDMVADYILAHVREDVGEEQPSRKVRGKNFMGEVNVCVSRDESGVRVELDVNNWDGVNLFYKSFTRGQFRDLCRGLGITPTAATPETPG